MNGDAGDQLPSVLQSSVRTAACAQQALSQVTRRPLARCQDELSVCWIRTASCVALTGDPTGADMRSPCQRGPGSLCPIATELPSSLAECTAAVPGGSAEIRCAGLERPHVASPAAPAVLRAPTRLALAKPRMRAHDLRSRGHPARWWWCRHQQAGNWPPTLPAGSVVGGRPTNSFNC